MSGLGRLKLQAWHVDLAGLGAVAALAAAAYLLLAQPLLLRRAAAQAQALELEAQRRTLDDLRASRRDTESRLTEVRRELQAQSVQLESRARVNDRLARLTDLAGTTGIQIEKLAPGATTDAPRHGTMSLHLIGRGAYADCERFLAQLHAQFNDTAVTRLRLASVPEDPKSPVTLDLDLLWFTAPDVKVEGH